MIVAGGVSLDEGVGVGFETKHNGGVQRLSLPAVLLVSTPLLVAAAPPPVVSFCEVAADPGRFMGREIAIRAEWLDDGIERSLLSDDRCAGRKGMGAGIIRPDAYKYVGTLMLHQLVVHRRYREHRLRLFATFAGRMVRVAPSNFEFHNDDGIRFEIDAISEPRFKYPARAAGSADRARGAPMEWPVRAHAAVRAALGGRR
jgi:hypothetical protein